MVARSLGPIGLVICSILLVPPVPSLAAPRGATVRLVPGGNSLRAGALITVTVKIAGGRNVGSVPFTIRYDPTILEFVGSSAVEGEFLRQGGAATSFMVSEGSPSRGGVVVGLSRLTGGRGARGKGTLCWMTFRARQPGVSPLTFSRASVLDPAARPLPSAFRGSSITVRGAP